MHAWSRLALVAVLTLSSLGAALSPAGNRALNSLGTAIRSVELLPELRQGPIPPQQMQTAKNLLRDLESALSRGRRALDGLSEADKADPDLVAAAQKLDEFAAFKADLEKAIAGSAAASAADDARFRAFRADTEPFAKAVSSFRNGPRGTLAAIKATSTELAKLDQLCRTKYPGIQDDPKLSFALNIEPGTWCDVAARREAIVDAHIKSVVAASGTAYAKQVAEDRESLTKNQGLLDVDGMPYRLLQNRAAGKAAIAAQLKPALEATGQAMPPDYFAALDAELDAFAAEIDRLAPTWPFDAPHRDAATEAGAKKAFAKQFPGQAVLKTGLLFANADIDKNALGVPTERYRTGALLAKGAGKWCEYRQFTAHETWVGGGRFAAPRFTFRAMRLQACK